jgi:hypothetical protein
MGLNIEENRRLLKENKHEFEQLFESPLLKFMSPFSGFNLSGFAQEFLTSVKTGSYADAVKELYGEKAVFLIFKLLGERSICDDDS